MNETFKEIQKYKKTFESFRKWLFIKVGKNKQSFETFGRYPISFQIPYFIEYLETKRTPVLSALLYYNYKTNTEVSFSKLCSYMIIMEFKRIEENLVLDYTPF